MGHRLSKIVTRTGDDGTTGLGDGARVDKDAPRIAAMGDLDELNSALGIVLARVCRSRCAPRWPPRRTTSSTSVAKSIRDGWP
jgi:cob(I)alamin adenosyltransferase